MSQQVPQQPIVFASSIGMTQDSYSKDEPVMMHFELKNTDPSTAYHVLKWHTPLEGFYNRFLKVLRGDQEVAYRGIMAKRGDPLADDYTLIPGGGSESATLDLRTAYDLSTEGAYTVQLDTKLFDVVPDKKGVEFKPHKLSEPMTSQPLTAGPVTFIIAG